MGVRDIVEKADLAVSNLQSDGGYLNPEQANKFIQIIHDEPTIINQCRTVVMNSPQRKIEKIGFGSRILRAAPSSGTPLASASRSKPDLGLITMTTKEIIAEVWIPYDVLEDNIEKANLETTIMTMIGRRAALDLEELIILGDTSSADTYLALMDGLIQLTPGGNIYNAPGVTDVTSMIFKKALQKMPTKYLRNRSLMKFFTSHHVEMELRDSQAQRLTTLGDEKLVQFTPMFAYGVPVTPCALMPNTKMWLSYPENLIFGIQRQISIEADRDIRRRVLIIVLTLRCALALEVPDACVLVQEFKDTGILTTTTSTTTTTAP